jgi:very-short-patch-repair endonuclease
MSKHIIKYNPKLKNTARNLRNNMTESEHMLWSRLRGKQILTVQFYRQKPIGKYIVDFYAPKTKLVIEVDGSQHMKESNSKRDKDRDRYLTELGIKVLRFNSREVLKDTDEVVEVIFRAMEKRLS